MYQRKLDKTIREVERRSKKRQNFADQVLDDVTTALTACKKRVDGERIVEGAWASIHAKIADIGYKEAKKEFGSKYVAKMRGFGTPGLESEMIGVNQRIAGEVKPYQEALQRLQKLDVGAYFKQGGKNGK